MEGIAIQRQGVAGSGHGCLSRLAELLQESPWHGGSTDALATDLPFVSRIYFLNKPLVL